MFSCKLLFSVCRGTRCLSLMLPLTILMAIEAAAQNAPLTEATSDRTVVKMCTVQTLDQADVPAREAGQIVAIDAKQGDQVKAEDVLAQLDDEDIKMAYYLAGYEYEAAFREAESDIEIRLAERSRDVAQAALEDAEEANARNNRKIFTDAEIRRRQFEVQRADATAEFNAFKQQQAQTTLKSKKAQLARAQVALDRHKIIAPISGEIEEVVRHVGEWVNPGDTVLRIIRMDKLKIVGYVKVSGWARHELLGRSVRIEVDAPGGQTETLTSTIAGISSKVKGASEYEVWAEIDNRRVGSTWTITPELTATMYLLDR